MDDYLRDQRTTTTKVQDDIFNLEVPEKLNFPSRLPPSLVA